MYFWWESSCLSKLLSKMKTFRISQANHQYITDICNVSILKIAWMFDSCDK